MNQELLGVDFFHRFLAENNVPRVMVPNGIQEEPLIDALERIFYRLLVAHQSQNNQERQENYDYIRDQCVEELTEDQRIWIRLMEESLNNNVPSHNNF
jgi:hypothetical protein